MENVLISFVSLLGLWVLYYYGWKPYRLDATRQELFALRDELMRYWVEHELPFENGAYRMAREVLNGTIRFSHKIRFLNLLTLVQKNRRYPEAGQRFETKLSQAMESLPPDARQRIKDTFREMHQLLLEQIVFSSVVWSLLYWVAFISQLARAIAKKLLGLPEWHEFDAEMLSQRDNSAFGH